MSDYSIADEVKDIISERLNVERKDVTNDATFSGDLGADSLDVVEVIMEFEKKFNIAIADDKAETIETVGDAIAFVENALKVQA